ncbi:YicC/YloC family endoribonuclease [Comamonas composti]|uniref:YicC/YloC family endoribonuclease n=1 Tax=Comamonas composti TaxID=408558 RepID=UPI00040C504F|nr:YicC/YloC family endoribonuclease [Comamonas composti]
MTGYASAQHSASAADGAASGANSRLGLEIRSVNSRFLDLSLRLPDELRAHEPVLRSLLTAGLKRGKVEVRAAIDLESGQALPQPSTDLLQRLMLLQDNVRSWLPDAAPLSVADAVRLCGSGSGPAADWSEVLPRLAEQALKDLVQARGREGKRLADMLQDRIAQLRTLAETATPLVPLLVEQQRQRFMERWKDAMALGEGSVAPETAQERALTEATAFAIRIDVAEEVTRLVSHLDEIQSLLKKGGEIGKRLDFLIQELHREANTLGSKSATLELTRISVDMKVLIEQMREQVQNIE